MKDYRSLPFAAYDLAVYLPGGAIILVLLAHLFGLGAVDDGVSTGGGAATSAIASQAALQIRLSANSTVNAVIEGLFWFSASYLTGHLAAFVSTYLIEKPVHNWLGFPSENYELRETEYQKILAGRSAQDFSPQDHEAFVAAVTQRQKDDIKTYKKGISAKVGMFANAPVFPFIVLFRIIVPLGFFNNKIPLGHRDRLENRLSDYGLGDGLMQDPRWHKLLEHVVANNFPAAFNRMYNYLIIYGALRLLALILLGAVWWSLAVFPWGIDLAADAIWRSKGFFENVWSIANAWFPFLALSTIYVMCVMAFAKFNRRYFEESVYALLVDGKASMNSHKIDHHFVGQS